MKEPINPFAAAVRAEQKQKNSNAVTVIVFAVLFVAVVSKAFLFPRELLFEWEESCLRINYPDGNTAVLEYEDVERIVLWEEISYGECLQGGLEDNLRYGTWKNSDFGEYQLCIENDVSCCVALYGAEKCFVINGESDETTRELAESIQEALEERGYLPST